MDKQYWLVACSCTGRQRESIYRHLRERSTDLCAEVQILEIPLNLKFGSFDDLIRLVDDLGKYDSQCENILRRIENQAVDIDPARELKVDWQKNSWTPEQFLRRFKWDDSKYPRTRNLRDNVDILIHSVHKSDEELRGKSAAFNEVRQSEQSADKAINITFLQRDLCDVLTPDIVQSDDFIEREHLMTVIVVVPRIHSDRFTECYERLHNQVVPRSARRFNVEDRDGNQIWRVIIFKTAEDAFKTAARENKFTVRDFKYSEEFYVTKQQERSKLKMEKRLQESFLSHLCFGTFSQIFIAWIHLKAMRVFVESVLRFGVPPNFAAFTIKLISSSKKMDRLRKELNDIFTSKTIFGQSYYEDMNPGSVDDEEEEEKYYPYVSLTVNVSMGKGTKKGGG